MVSAVRPFHIAPSAEVRLHFTSLSNTASHAKTLASTRQLSCCRKHAQRSCILSTPAPDIAQGPCPLLRGMFSNLFNGFSAIDKSSYPRRVERRREKGEEEAWRQSSQTHQTSREHRTGLKTRACQMRATEHPRLKMPNPVSVKPPRKRDFFLSLRPSLHMHYVVMSGRPAATRGASKR